MEADISTRINDVLFSRPIPADFAITRLACGFMDDDKVSDLTALFDNLSFKLLADAPQDDFQLQLRCDPIHVSKVLGVQFVLDGLIIHPATLQDGAGSSHRGRPEQPDAKR